MRDRRYRINLVGGRIVHEIADLLLGERAGRETDAMIRVHGPAVAVVGCALYHDDPVGFAGLLHLVRLLLTAQSERGATLQGVRGRGGLGDQAHLGCYLRCGME